MQTSLNSPPRVALFPDTYLEANGVATLSRHLVEFAKSRDYPLLVVRGGPRTALSRDGSVETLELKRGFTSFPLDKSLYFDPLLSRHRKLVVDRLNDFKPDLVHMTGPGDLGFLGLLVSHMVHVPLIASWHTNLHEYLSRRMNRGLRLVPDTLRTRAAGALEKLTLRGLMRFYRTSRFVFAPTQELANLLHARTGKTAFLMPHGVDLTRYSPAPRQDRGDRPFCIGYVGRLTTEKNVRSFVELERALLAAGEDNFRFLIVGEGGQQNWLRKNLRHAEIPGVLRGEQLAAAYGQMDAFVFPSSTDTFGLVVLEAMASGVPVILSPDTGRRIGVKNGVSGLLSADFAASVLCLMHDEGLRDRMACAARQFANSKSWNSVFERLYETYAQGLAMLNEVAKPVIC